MRSAGAILCSSRSHNGSNYDEHLVVVWEVTFKATPPGPCGDCLLPNMSMRWMCGFDRAYRSFHIAGYVLIMLAFGSWVPENPEAFSQ